MATNSCEIYSAIRRPLDAFIQYFLDVKPYHTKLLEVLEIYNFYETINVTIGETTFKNVTFKNKPLCNATGWGVDWDDECGFDAISCCDLFDCIGGYGLIYNNSDLLVTANIISTSQDGSLTLDGNYTYDLKLPIKAILNDSQFSVRGNYTSTFNTFNLFLVIPRHIYDITTVTANGFQLTGDLAAEIASRKNFIVYASAGNDGRYDVETATYDPDTNLTNIVVVQPIKHVGGTGSVEVNASNKNNGVYQVSAVTFNGLDTIVTVNSGAKRFTVLNDPNMGSVQFRSGLIYPRHVTLTGSSSNNDGDYRILQSAYDYTNDVTTLTFSELIPDVSTTGTVNLYGYEYQAGFDAGPECSIPKPADIHMVLSERLVINVVAPVTPTPTISNSASSTRTPTPTPTHTSTPAPTPTPTPTMPSAGAFEYMFQINDLELGLVKHDGVHKTEVASSTLSALGIGEAFNIASDSNKTAFVPDYANNQIVFVQYDGTSFQTSSYYLGFAPSQIAVDTANNVIFIAGDNVFVSAYQYDYVAGMPTIIAALGNQASPFPWPSQLMDTNGRAVSILQNGKIAIASNLNVVVASFTYTSGVDNSGLFTPVVSMTNTLTDGFTNYGLGRRFTMPLTDGTKYVLPLDNVARTGETNIVPRFFAFNSATPSIQDMGNLIGSSLADSLDLSISSDFEKTIIQQDSGAYDTYNVSYGTFPPTFTLAEALTPAASVGGTTGDKIYYSYLTGVHRLYVMKPSFKHIYSILSADTYTDISPTDDTCNSAISDTVHAAAFVSSFT